MSTSHHTPHGFGAPLTSAEINRPLGTLDAAIASVIATGSGTSTTLTAQANSGQATLAVASSAGFAPGDPIYIGTGATFESRIVATVPGGGVTITVTVNLTNTYAIGKPVSKSPVELVDARSGLTSLKGRLDQINSGVFRVSPSGADDTSAIQAAITAAFNLPGGTVVFAPGTYTVSATLATPANVSGSIALVGAGRPRSFTTGQNGDPVANQGVTINYTGTTGDIFLASVTSGDKRQYITIEKIYFQGNVATGTTGHGLHFQATIATVAILPTLRDVTVNGAKQHGIFYDGNVFESQMYNVRVSQCGDRGLKLAANGGGLPGETRLYGCTINQNSVGLDVTGGGAISLFGVSLSYNTNEGIIATGVGFMAVDLTLEVNAPLAGNQATFTSMSPVIISAGLTVKAAATGKGLSFVGCTAGSIQRLGSNASVAAGGYVDVSFDNTTSRCSLIDYMADDGIDRYSLGTLGAHTVRRGGHPLTGHLHSQQLLTSAITAAVTPDIIKYDSILLTGTGSGITITINDPTRNTEVVWHQGERVIFHVYNNSAGALTIAWGSLYALAGAWVSPAAGKTRLIAFEWNQTRGRLEEVARSAADIT